MGASNGLWSLAAVVIAGLTGCVGVTVPDRTSPIATASSPEAVVLTAVRAPAAEDNATRWSGSCGGADFSVTWSWPPDRLIVEIDGAVQVYGAERAFMRDLFLPSAPLILYSRCGSGDEAVSVQVLSVRRSPTDEIRLVRGELVFTHGGELTAYYGPHEAWPTSLPEEVEQ